MVILDTDVLLLAYAFPKDARQQTNSAFLERVRSDSSATTIYNLMELLGQLSFNVSPERLFQWKSWLVDAHQLAIIWPINPEETTSMLSFRQEIYERPLARMQTHRMPFMDALILGLAERTPKVEQFVTWNARHFQGKTGLQVLTPEAYLEHVH